MALSFDQNQHFCLICELEKVISIELKTHYCGQQ